MQREIKYRGYSTALKKWAYGYLMYDNNNPVISNEEQYLIVKENTVGQYTGLKDKNGKEIYEFDECEVTRTCVWATGFIKFHQGCFIFQEYKTGNILRLCELELNGYSIKVTGTVVDNPELS